MRTRLSRRQFLSTSLAALGAAALAACAPAAAPTEAPKPTEAQAEAPAAAPTAVPPTPVPAAEGAQRIRLGVWADVQDAVVYQNLINVFHGKQTKYMVVAEQYPGGYYEKIQANFAAGDPADVIYYQGWMWQPYAEDKVIIPLDEYIQKTNLSSKFPQTENYKNTTQWHGSTYMTPTDTGSLVVYYNKDLFDKQGVPYPKKGWTWEEFQDTVKKLSFKDGDTQYYGFAQAGGWNGAYGRCISFMRRNGYVEWDQVIEPHKQLWDHEDVISGLQFVIYDTIKNNWCPSPDVISGGGVGVNTGRCAMVVEGPWYLPQCWGELALDKKGINYDVVEAPVGTAGKNFTFSHVHGHVMSAASKGKDGGWELIQFILSDEGQKLICEGGRMAGTPEGIDSIWAPIASKAYNFTNTKAFSDGMREGATPVIFGKGTDLNAYGGAPIQAIWDALLGLQMTADEAIKRYGPDIQTAIDQYWADRGQS